MPEIAETFTSFQSPPGFTSHSDSDDHVKFLVQLSGFNPHRASQVIPTSQDRYRLESLAFQSPPGFTSHSDLVVPDATYDGVVVSIPTGLHKSFRLPEATRQRMSEAVFQSPPGFTSHSDTITFHVRGKGNCGFNPHRASQVIPTYPHAVTLNAPAAFQSPPGFTSHSDQFNRWSTLLVHWFQSPPGFTSHSDVMDVPTMPTRKRVSIPTGLHKSFRHRVVPGAGIESIGVSIPTGLHKSFRRSNTMGTKHLDQFQSPPGFTSHSDAVRVALVLVASLFQSPPGFTSHSDAVRVALVLMAS